MANFVGPVSGGMRVAIDELGKGYIEAGHERILVIPGATDKVTETEAGIIVEVGSPRIAKDYRMIARPWRALAALERFNPTSVEISDKWTLSPVGRWARKRGIGSILFSHERLDDMLSAWLKRQFGVEAAVGALNRRLAKEFDAVVVTSRYAADEFDHTGANLKFVPLGVDLQTFRPDRRPAELLDLDAARSRHEAGLPPVRLCYVGRMSHEKHPQLGVEAAVELHRRGVPFTLDMYGTGPDLEHLRELAGDAPVQFHGFVDGRAAVAQRFASSDISLSVSPYETFGLAVLEALASGTPVVTSNQGGAHELVDASSGEAATPDAVGIADAVERAIGRLGPDLRAAARARAEQFTWGRSVEAMLELHEQVSEFRAWQRERWQDQNRPPRPTPPPVAAPTTPTGVRTIEQAVHLASDTGLTGWDLVDWVTQLVNQNYQDYSVAHWWESPQSSFANGRGSSNQYNQVLAEILHRLGFDVRLVHAARVRLSGAPWWQVGHTWLQVSIDGRTLDVCASRSTNRAGAVAFTTLTPVRPFRPITSVATTAARVPFVTAGVLRAKMQHDPLPRWIERPFNEDVR